MVHPRETKVNTLSAVGQADVKGYTCLLELFRPASVAPVKVCTGYGAENIPLRVQV